MRSTLPMPCASSEYDYPKRLSFPTAALILEEEEQRFGKNPWQHGLAPNAHTLEKFMQYAAIQGYTTSALSIEEAFWPGIRRPIGQSLRDARGAPPVLGRQSALGLSRPSALRAVSD